MKRREFLGTITAGLGALYCASQNVPAQANEVPTIDFTPQYNSIVMEHVPDSVFKESSEILLYCRAKKDTLIPRLCDYVKMRAEWSKCPMLSEVYCYIATKTIARCGMEYVVTGMAFPSKNSREFILRTQMPYSMSPSWGSRWYPFLMNFAENMRENGIEILHVEEYAAFSRDRKNLPQWHSSMEAVSSKILKLSDESDKWKAYVNVFEFF